ncbi:uncharacterized protein LOC132639172 [Lycium barbarum]|uniref:uncharacterized protein LOC132639172 n=1 Tax=Lycium barbarum TaxID=112863 RepID=UPI00293F349A|nr:uncharacterized protein LOC132639172 [Lycium barbarum]
MGTSWHNVNGKIWIFVDAEIQVEIMRDTEQLLSCRFTHLGDGQELALTVVYASTDRSGRIALWEDLYDMSSHITIPWLVGGDFNVITDDIEKFGGLPVQFAETEDFRQCIDICQLMDLGFTGSMFTWWNGRSDEACIFKRLDRCLGNQALQNCFPNLEVEHLIKQGSNHSPLLVNMRADSRPIRKSFRFLNFWVEHESFLDVIKENWVESYGSDPFFNFHNKLKKVGRALSKWSRDTYGDIFKQIATLEEVVQVHEQEFEQNPTGLNRERLQRVQADLIRFYAIEEKIWRQKAGMKCAGGPDGFTGRFFQACWEIIANDFLTMVRSFFCGHELLSKVISRIIHERLIYLLPKIISPQQSGFVKGRSIVENIMLAQEIVHDIRIRKKPANVVIKLDMEKAYDRVSWVFLTKVLRRMGFGEFTIDLVFRVISNNWALNALHTEAEYKEYGMPKWSPYSVRLVMKTLSNYEKVSGQKINKQKSVVYMHHLTSHNIKELVFSVTQIPKKDFPFTYLGVPIYYGRRRNIHYKEIIEKIQNRLSSWTGKLLSIGGRTTLIKHVLQIMPIHLLSACDPPSAILAQIHRLFAKFFWSNSVGNSNFECDPTIILVKETAEVGQWDEQLLRRILPEDLADHIVQNINPPNENGQADKAFWKLDSRGKFTVGFWKFKLPLDDKLKKWGHQFPSRCYCCQHPEVEDTSHVFLHSPTAQAIWKYFCGPIGINTENLQVPQNNHTEGIPTSSETQCNQDVEKFYQHKLQLVGGTFDK